MCCSILLPHHNFTRKATACLHSFVSICADRVVVGLVIRMKNLLISLFSGIIGVLLTIGYQHFWAPPQSFTFIIDGEEVVVTQSEYMELVEQNEKLQDEFINLKSKYEKSNVDETATKEIISKLQSENSQIQQENLQLQDDLIDLKREIANLQNTLELYKERYGYLNMDTANENKTVSIITLETFQGVASWYNSSHAPKSIGSSNSVDTYGNEYPDSYLATHFHLNDKDKYTPTYLLDGKYSKCEGKIAWSKSDKNTEGSVWIEFYSDDELIYQTDPISASDRALSFEFSVKEIEKLTVVQKATRKAGYIYIIYPYFNLIK